MRIGSEQWEAGVTEVASVYLTGGVSETPIPGTWAQQPDVSGVGWYASFSVKVGGMECCLLQPFGQDGACSGSWNAAAGAGCGHSDSPDSTVSSAFWVLMFIYKMSRWHVYPFSLQGSMIPCF